MTYFIHRGSSVDISDQTLLVHYLINKIDFSQLLTKGIYMLFTKLKPWTWTCVSMSVNCIITKYIVEVCVLKSIVVSSYAGLIVRPNFLVDFPLFWTSMKPTNSKPNIETSSVKAWAKNLVVLLHFTLLIIDVRFHVYIR